MCRTKECFWKAELYRLYGELSLRIGEAETAAAEAETSTKESVSSSPVLSSSARFPGSSPEDAFHKAIAIARHQRAKSLELRAVMSLARLWQQQGKRKETRQMLAEIYGWFTGGFDTADLQAAKASLGALV